MTSRALLSGIPVAMGLILLASACGDPTTDDPTPAPGTERGPCLADGSCDAPLTCASDLCVRLPEPDASHDTLADTDTDPTADALPDDADALPDDADALPDDPDGSSDTEPTDTAADVLPDTTDDALADTHPTDDISPDAPDGLASLIPRDVFDTMFLHRADPACEGGIYTWDHLIEASEAWPEFARTGSATDRKREVAAFLANISHETTGGWPTAPDGPQSWGLCFVQEVGCGSGACTGYCDPTNAQYPCAPGRTYHGRGAIQLSWNYNYGLCGDALGVDLLNDPDQVATDGRLAFLTAIWFWMTPQPPKPSAHDVMTGAWQPTPQDRAAGRVPGFGMTINIINGGLECNQPTNSRVEDRVAFYLRYCDLLGVDPGDALRCDQMQSY